MSEMYSKYAAEYAEAIENNIYNSLYDKPSLLSLVESQKFVSCLDLGCGPGAYLGSLQKFCETITAIDLSPEFIKIVSSRFPNVKSYVSDISKGLPQERDRSFDLVISPLTIHYIEDLKFLFSEVRRVLKDRGTFAFSTHHPILDFADSVSGNYFEREKLTQLWNTLPGRKAEVTFYRRPLSETLNSLLESGFVVDGFSEGKPSEKIKDISESHYQRLKTKPQFLFVRARKDR